MLAGLRAQVSPAGETDDVRETVPVKPWTGATVIVDVPVVPALSVMVVGLAVIVKSDVSTVTVTVAE